MVSKKTLEGRIALLQWVIRGDLERTDNLKIRRYLKGQFTKIREMD